MVVHREVNCLSDIVMILRDKCGLWIPDATSEDWECIPFMNINVQCDLVVDDGIREVRKTI